MTGPVAVTGATGFLGRRLVARLLACGHEVIALSRRPAGGVPTRAWQAGEAPDLHGIGTVIHAAAHRPARYDDPAEAGALLRVNAEATAALVEAAARAGVARFVYVSTGAVYPADAGAAHEGDPVGAAGHAPYYVASKLCGEWFVAAARISAIIVRPSAIYGAGMPPGLVATFVGRLAAGEGVTVADAGRFTADLVHVDDVAEGIVAAASAGRAPVYNLGGGSPVTTLDLARTVARLVGAPEDRITIAPPSGGRRGLWLDIGQARADLRYAPRTIEDGVREMLSAGRRG